MITSLQHLICRHERIAKFLLVGAAASLVHGVISWIFYYHVWGGCTILSTLVGYAGGWAVSYIGNRLWSFRSVAKQAPKIRSITRFLLSQGLSMSVLLASTWLLQQLIILYFWWYIITNNLSFTPELRQFSTGASYPPALLAGMLLAAACSYLTMRQYVFKSPAR